MFKIKTLKIHCLPAISCRLPGRLALLGMRAGRRLQAGKLKIINWKLSTCH